MNWNDLLIEILNMTKEEREQPIYVSPNKEWADVDCDKVVEVYRPTYINPDYNVTHYLISN